MKKSSKSRKAASRSLLPGGPSLIDVGKFNAFLAVLIMGLLAVVGTWVVTFGHAADSSIANTVASVKPAGDGPGSYGVVGANSAVPVLSTTNLYQDVDDGTNFLSSDADSTYVETDPTISPGNTSAVFAHVATYAGVPAGRVITAVANFTARAVGGNAGGTSVAPTGQARAIVLDGGKVIGTGQWHALNANYQNFSDTFSGLNVIDGNTLQTRVEMMRGPSTTAVHYTMVWLDLLVQPPRSYYLKPASTGTTTVVGINAGAKTYSNLWQLVDDGIGFTKADDEATYVKTQGVGSSGMLDAYYPLTAAGTLEQAVVSYRARSTANAPYSTIMVELWDGPNQIAVGKPHTLSSTYGNFTDKFTNLNVPLQHNNTDQLHTKVIMENPNGQGDARFTQVWLRADEVLPQP